MKERAIIVRETVVSIVINVFISIGFFMAVFGLAAPVVVGRMATDFLPQTFMVTLMGTLVPSLMLRRKRHAATGPILVRSVGLAVATTLIVGGAAFWLCSVNGDAMLPAWSALILRAAYGGLLAAVTTPIALIALFRSPRSIP